jgi:hypothetical protein
MLDNNWFMIGSGFFAGIIASYIVRDIVYSKDTTNEVD